MKRKRLYIVMFAIFMAAAGTWIYQKADAGEAPKYRTATVERGNLELSVSSTGTLNAVTTVSVGTQVSGQVAEIFVDFNDRVTKGQLLARIDPTLAEQAVADAQATVESRRADSAMAQQEYERNRSLRTAGLVSDSVFEASQSRLTVTRAALKSAGVSLERARQNLAFTEIVAPIDGVVVERNVDQGQTVAASLSAPQLFLIANDLSQMQILASVDESDISLIAEQQPVRFTVQAIQRQTFEGKVRQVRLQSTMQDNVVNYTVVVSVENKDGKLLPGMTANVDFLAKSAENVLIVPSAALRFTPPEDQLAQLRESRERGSANGTATAPAGERRRGNTGAERGQRGGNRERPTDAGRIWTVADDGTLTPVRVRIGINDGSRTEITAQELKEGTRVVTGFETAQSQAAQQAPASSPFNNNNRQQPRRPGGF
ncbi:MAG TPA: efflux RND transporter periplasmic adaptor subunit [Thermoanaerobaculia bacterium]